jgi:CheY-like chemotaxis protein
VLTNLLLNALDALPEGGQIAVSCGRVNGTARVIVGDNGTGIPMELMERIFDPFFTTKGDKGTGLGLAVSKKIIEGHGGHIRVSSGKDKGTTFVIDLPALEEEKGLQPSVQGTPSPIKGRKVLIIQGQEVEISELQQCLTNKNCRVTIAESGARAILICAKEKFDLLVVDLTLPDINGLDLISQIRSFDRKTKIILISDHEIEASVGDLMSKGIDSLLTRPIDGGLISMTLENLFGLAQARN